MYKLIKEIAARSYESAKNRGKDVTCQGCKEYLGQELAEYWEAIHAEQDLGLWRRIITNAETMADSLFVAYYDAHIHNTATDELADILITAATWTRAAELAGGEHFRPDHSLDVILACGAVFFVSRAVHSLYEAECLRRVVNLKLRYNDLRPN